MFTATDTQANTTTVSVPFEIDACANFVSAPTTCGVGTCAATGSTSGVAGTITDSCETVPAAAPSGDCNAPIPEPWTPSIGDVMNLADCLVGLGDCTGLKPQSLP